jgi:hypothetical protein
MDGNDVAQTLATGLRSHGVEASAEVRPTSASGWFLSLDYAPEGIDLEVAEHSDTVRVSWSGGTVDSATLDEALDYALRDAGIAR